jgi:hypothetical protein
MESDRLTRTADDLFSAISRLIDRRLAARAEAGDRIREYVPGTTSSKGLLVRHGGWLWAAAYTTRRTPGDGPSWSKVFTEQAR